ncbi:HdeD family acid-resistance protein [Rhizobium grahamii]|uniref:HdeD family acid-resistance protein n=1 Tax=Rhizobium grahamii TaxID=1120045 RepID=A0A5Q0C1S6_9HYPH|nr:MULTISPECIES: HdeD family acid-resistance protein [Rhizobium]QFY59383.1 HdeD family acid-resistance protein [Rhizobium grahamii]QRM48090.1 HdeD family acid-resistance protein [Rhizobium sp. BG6]
MTDISDRLSFSSLQSKWGWFVALGVLLIVCGFIAAGNIVFATVASVYYVGMLMLIGGVVYLVHAFQVRTWEQVLFWALSGVLYVLAGVFAFMNPLLASAALTLFLAIALLIAGVFRTWVGWRMRPLKGWGWVLLSGIITALAGVVIYIGWPVNSLWILGLFLACDLLIQGWSMLAFGLSIRR